MPRMELTKGEIKFCEYQRGMTGSFFTKLFEAMTVSDGENLEKLKKAFPEEVASYIRYRDEDGYWPWLKKTYEEV